MHTTLRTTLGIASLAGLLGLTAAAHAAQNYLITEFQDPPVDAIITIGDMNDSGVVVGHYRASGNITYACQWQGGTFAPLPVAADVTNSFAFGVNASGIVVGYVQDANGSHAYAWGGASEPVLELPAGMSSFARGINASGVVVGFYGSPFHPCAWTGGAFVPLPLPAGATSATASGVNADGRILGNFSDATGSHGCIWSDATATATVTPLADPVSPTGGQITGVAATAIDASGQVSGRYADAGEVRPCVWPANSTPTTPPTLLPVPDGAGNTYTYKINAAGTRVVGASGVAPGGAIGHACTWFAGEFSPLPEPGGDGTKSTVTAINDAGQIAGVYRPAGAPSDHAYLLTPIPEVTPPPVPKPAAPVVKVSGAKKLTTAKAKLTIKGKATGAVTSVTAKVGKKTVKARGTASWSLKAALKPGKNKITVTAHGPGGDSAPARLTVTRKK